MLRAHWVASRHPRIFVQSKLFLQWPSKNSYHPYQGTPAPGEKVMGTREQRKGVPEVKFPSEKPSGGSSYPRVSHRESGVMTWPQPTLAVLERS